MNVALSHLFFDLDGTLVDSRPGIVSSLVWAFEKFGVAAPNPADIVIGPPIEETIAAVTGLTDTARIATIARAYRARYSDVGVRESALYPGIRELLSELVRRYTLFVVTAKATPQARELLEHFDLATHFRGIFGCDLGTKRALIAEVLRANAFTPECALMVGDRGHDIEAARQNGVAAVGVGWGYGTVSELQAAGATRVVGTASELRQLLLP